MSERLAGWMCVERIVSWLKKVEMQGETCWFIYVITEERQGMTSTSFLYFCNGKGRMDNMDNAVHVL